MLIKVAWRGVFFFWGGGGGVSMDGMYVWSYLNTSYRRAGAQLRFSSESVV